jgi:hypothetical protein
MKGLTVFLLMAFPYWSYPQGAFANQTNSTLQTVLSDYPLKFRNIRGALINKDPQSSDFASKAELPGSINTVITQYSSTDDKEVFSWRSVVMATEEFETATQKYKEIFTELSNSIIKIDGQKPFILTGVYTTPTDEKRFNSSTLQLLPAASGELARAKVEIVLEYLVTEWKVSVLVYDEEEGSLVME